MHSYSCIFLNPMKKYAENDPQIRDLVEIGTFETYSTNKRRPMTKRRWGRFSVARLMTVMQR